MTSRRPTRPQGHPPAPRGRRQGPRTMSRPGTPGRLIVRVAEGRPRLRLFVESAGVGGAMEDLLVQPVDLQTVPFGRVQERARHRVAAAARVKGSTGGEAKRRGGTRFEKGVPPGIGS